MHTDVDVLFPLTLPRAATDEGDVQAARAKAAAAGIPSSEPMTLDELEAVQARMDAKRKASPSSKFNAGEHFLSQPSFAAQPVSSSNVQHTRSGSEPMSAARQDSAQGGADQDAVWKDLGAEGNSLQSSGASPAYVPFNSPDAGSSDGAGMLRQVSGELSASQSSSAAEAPSYEVIDDEDGTVTSAEEALDETEMAELKVCTSCTVMHCSIVGFAGASGATCASGSGMCATAMCSQPFIEHVSTCDFNTCSNSHVGQPPVSMCCFQTIICCLWPLRQVTDLDVCPS